MIHEVAGLTHNHIRGQIACGLYYFCVKAILDGQGELIERLQDGFDRGFKFYEGNIAIRTELAYYGRLRDIKELASMPEDSIKSGGYVVESLEAAIAGGLAGLYYGYDSIPEDWLAVIRRREWIEEMF